MMKTGLLCIAIVFLLVPVFIFSNVNARARINEEQALNALLTAIEKDNLYGAKPNMSCFTIFTEEEGKDHFDFSVHKNRGSNCTGNPHESPMVDRFRVDRSSRKIQWYHPTDGRPLALKAFLKSRSRS
jgi:hypothetical protein